MARGHIVSRECPLPRGDIDHEFSTGRKVKQGSAQEAIFVCNVFEDVKQIDGIKVSFQLWLFLKNVITAHAAAAAHILLQGVLIQVETGHFSVAGILDLPLKKTVAASNFSHFSGAAEHFVSQLLKHIKTPTNPEMFHRRNLEPTVCHADFARL